MIGNYLAIWHIKKSYLLQLCLCCIAPDCKQLGWEIHCDRRKKKAEFDRWWCVLERGLLLTPVLAQYQPEGKELGGKRVTCLRYLCCFLYMSPMVHKLVPTARTEGNRVEHNKKNFIPLGPKFPLFGHFYCAPFQQFSLQCVLAVTTASGRDVHIKGWVIGLLPKFSLVQIDSECFWKSKIKLRTSS